MIELIDYTLDEALRRSVPLDGVYDIMSMLRRYGITLFDVYLRHVHAYRSAILSDELPSSVRCRVRPASDDLALARAMGFTKVAVLWSHSLNRTSLFKLEAALEAAREFATEIYLVVEDAAPGRSGCFDLYWPLIQRYGVVRLVYCDSRSRLDPLIARSRMNELVKSAICPVEFSGGNLLGLATANSLAALKAGISHLGVSVAGVGPKGRAAMEEVLMVLKTLWRQPLPVPTESLAADCAAVLAAMNIPLAEDKAVIGPQVFAHESGIHVDGISKHPGLYEALSPHEVGLERKLVIGKHSGTASLRLKFKEWNQSLPSEEASLLLTKVRERAAVRKRSVNDLELMELYREVRGEDGERR
ncbi:2-isopropylmalate synthase [compost metagenome]